MIHGYAVFTATCANHLQSLKQTSINKAIKNKKYNKEYCHYMEISYNSCAYQESRSRECKNAIATLARVSALL